MKLSVLIPVYNDRDYIERAVAEVKAVEYPIPIEIVAVDDGSTDGSREVLAKIEGITSVFHEKNQGKGAAIRTALKHATGDILAIQDDDCEYDPAVLPSLIEPIIKGEAQVVYGSRFLGNSPMFKIQRLQNKAVTTLGNMLLGQRLTDFETGHKIFSRRSWSSSTSRPTASNSTWRSRFSSCSSATRSRSCPPATSRARTSRGRRSPTRTASAPSAPC